MKEKILLVGYGSIGKRHARNLLGMNITPYILTSHPDRLNAVFLKDIKGIRGQDFKYCIISSATAKHGQDLERCLRYLPGLKKILIEKPLESSYLKGKKIKERSEKLNLEVSVAYNLRFLRVFDKIRGFVQKQINKIRIVEAVAGMDLRQWRPKRNMAFSYSAKRKAGGGVDLDLSHEVDYILWLFRDNFKTKFIYRKKISNLKINSPDIFKLILGYDRFVVDITLDYIRKAKDRYLKIICEDGNNLFYDFVTARLSAYGKVTYIKNDLDESYRRLLRAFLEKDSAMRQKICSVDEALNVLKVLGV